MLTPTEEQPKIQSIEQSKQTPEGYVGEEEEEEEKKKKQQITIIFSLGVARETQQLIDKNTTSDLLVA